MLQVRRQLAQDVAAQLVPLEEDIDSAIVRQAKLQITAIEGRRQARLPLDAGQKALELAAEAVSALLTARAKIHEAHIAFRQVQDDMGVKVKAYGDMGDTPMGYAVPETPALSVVSAEAA